MVFLCLIMLYGIAIGFLLGLGTADFARDYDANVWIPWAVAWAIFAIGTLVVLVAGAGAVSHEIITRLAVLG